MSQSVRMRYSHRVSIALLPILALGATSCGQTSEREGAGTNLDELPQLLLEEVTRIGSLEDPDYGFSRIGDVQLPDDGNVYLFESAAREIRVYSPDGELLRKVGRPGEGPGEFSAPNARFGVRGDTVWVYEPIGGRLTLFERSGTLISANRIQEVRVPLHVPGFTAIIGPSFLDGDGLFVGDQSFSSRIPDPQAQTATLDSVVIPRVLFNGRGEVLDTVGSVPSLRSGSPMRFLDVGQSRYVIPAAPSRMPVYVTTADQIIRIDRHLPDDQRSLRVVRMANDHTILRESTFSYVPKSFPSEVLDSAVTRNVGVGNVVVSLDTGAEMLQRRAEDSAAARVAMRAQLEFPEFQAPVRSVLVASDGGVWLRREDMGGSTDRWTVLDTEDDPLGEVVLSKRMRIAWTDGRQLWAVDTDDLGVPWLVHLRVIMP